MLARWAMQSPVDSLDCQGQITLCRIGRFEKWNENIGKWSERKLFWPLQHAENYHTELPQTWRCYRQLYCELRVGGAWHDMSGPNFLRNTCGEKLASAYCLPIVRVVGAALQYITLYIKLMDFWGDNHLIPPHSSRIGGGGGFSKFL